MIEGDRTSQKLTSDITSTLGLIFPGSLPQNDWREAIVSGRTVASPVNLFEKAEGTIDTNN